MTTPNPLHVANTAQQMARSAPREDAVVFNRVAMVCMGVMAAASAAQMLQSILREFNRVHDSDHRRGGRGR